MDEQLRPAACWADAARTWRTTEQSELVGVQAGAQEREGTDGCAGVSEAEGRSLEAIAWFESRRGDARPGWRSLVGTIASFLITDASDGGGALVRRITEGAEDTQGGRPSTHRLLGVGTRSHREGSGRLSKDGQAAAASVGGTNTAG